MTVCVVLPFSPLMSFLVFLSSSSGRLLDATKNYMYIFLLAGSEVLLSAVVLFTCTYFCIGKNKSSAPAPAHSLEDVTVTGDEKTEFNDEEEKGAREEQEMETMKMVEMELKEVEEDEELEEVGPGGKTVDSQEVEKFLKDPHHKGDKSSSSIIHPETCLWAGIEFVGQNYTCRHFFVSFSFFKDIPTGGWREFWSVPISFPVILYSCVDVCGLQWSNQYHCYWKCKSYCMWTIITSCFEVWWFILDNRETEWYQCLVYN